MNFWDFERWLTTRGRTKAPLATPNPPASMAQVIAVRNGWRYGQTATGKQCPFQYFTMFGVSRKEAREAMKRVQRWKYHAQAA